MGTILRLNRIWVPLLLCAASAAAPGAPRAQSVDTDLELIVRLSSALRGPAGPRAMAAELPGLQAWRPAYLGANAGVARGAVTSEALAQTFVATFTSRRERDDAWAQLANHPDVAYAEPVVPIHLEEVAGLESASAGRRGSGTEPGDALYPEQWALERIGMPRVWASGTGTPGITVGVVDTGVALDHPDLSPNLAINAAEAGGLAGVDDDGNGFADDIYGWDFMAGAPNPDDGHGHGTHVAGIIGAASDGAFGIVGVTWDVGIIPVKMFTDRGKSTNLAGAQGIVYAVERGADIVNLSWGTPSYSQAILDAVRFAEERGVILVSSAGNAAQAVTEYYPAALDPVITVGASTPQDRPANFSNRGVRIDLVAPGTNVLSAWRDTHHTLSGTSQAAPHVAGVCAHYLSRYPNATPRQVRAALKSTAVDVGARNWDPVTGVGRLNAPAALAMVDPPIAQLRTPRSLDAVGGGAIVCSGDVEGSATTGYLAIGQGVNPSRWGILREVGPGTDQVFATVDARTLAEGEYTVLLAVEDVAGRQSEDRRLIWIDRAPPELVRYEPLDVLDGGRFRQRVRLVTSERVRVELKIREAQSQVPFETLAIPDFQTRHTFDLVDRLPGHHDVQVHLTDLAGQTTLAPEAGVFERQLLPLIDIPTDRFHETAVIVGFEFGVVADLDGDGWPEILGEQRAAGEPEGDLVLYGFQGGGPTQLRRPGPQIRGLPVAAGDLNGDGRPEVAVLGGMSPETGMSTLTVYADLLQTEPRIVFERADASRRYKARIADVNGDGLSELLYALGGTSVLQALTFATGNATPVPLEFDGPAPRVAEFALGDFDADGLTELAMGTGRGNVVVLEERGGGFVETFNAPLHGGLSNAFVATGLPDADGDGKPEFAIHAVGVILDREERPGVAIFEATGNDTYEEVTWLELPAKNTPFDNDLASIDVDGDSTPEMVIAVGDDVYVVDAVADNRFVPIWYGGREGAGRVASADLKRSGELDVVLVELSEAGPRTRVFEPFYEPRVLPLRWTVVSTGQSNRIEWASPPAGVLVSNLAVYRVDQNEPGALESELTDRRIHVERGELGGAGFMVDSGGTPSVAYRLAYTAETDANIRRELTGALSPRRVSAVPISLASPLPNPFVVETSIPFEMHRRALVDARVYDASGRLIRVLAKRSFEVGLHTLTWDGVALGGTAVASGVYFVRVEADGHRQVRKVLRLR